VKAMGIQYRDFAPQWKTKVLGLAVGGRQSVDDVVAQANAWIEAQAIEVVNIETLILPESAAEQSQQSGHSDMRYNIGMFEIVGKRMQVVRVWYRSAA